MVGAKAVLQDAVIGDRAVIVECGELLAGIRLWPGVVLRGACDSPPRVNAWLLVSTSDAGRSTDKGRSD